MDYLLSNFYLLKECPNIYLNPVKAQIPVVFCEYIFPIYLLMTDYQYEN